MRIGFNGALVDERVIRAGFIGCGSHAFRNIFPTFQFAPVELAAVCDLDLPRAHAFAGKFGAANAYGDYREMLQKEKLDAVFVVTSYDENHRPRYPRIATDCVAAGCHVWIEKPPAASVAELTALQEAAAAANKTVMVGLKKMFVPANAKAKELMSQADFGNPTIAMFQYPQYVPTLAELQSFRDGNRVDKVTWFLDHLCHPASVLLYLMGMPRTLHYQRSAAGGGIATFTFESGAAASLALTYAAPTDGGLERSTIVSDQGRMIVVENNSIVRYHRDPPYKPGEGYGTTPSYYGGLPGEATAVWTPEFSLGQLYNKGLFMLGYYDEVNEFARAILEQRQPTRGTLQDAVCVTRIFEAFANGPGKEITFD